MRITFFSLGLLNPLFLKNWTRPCRTVTADNTSRQTYTCGDADENAGDVTRHTWSTSMTRRIKCSYLYAYLYGKTEETRRILLYSKRETVARQRRGRGGQLPPVPSCRGGRRGSTENILPKETKWRRNK